MNRTVHEISRYEDARAALANQDLVPEVPEAPPVAEGKEGASMAWLRASVPRFSSGAAHARRRALVEAELARLDVARLRKAAARWPEGEDAAPYVVSTLAEALEYREPHAVAEAVGTVSRVYFGGEDPEADAAVARLVELLSPPGERQGRASGNRSSTAPECRKAPGSWMARVRWTEPGSRMALGGRVATGSRMAPVSP